MERIGRSSGAVTEYLLGEVAAHRLAYRTLEEYDWSGNDLARIAIEDILEKKEWDKGIGLVGWTGVGKTHLLVALYKERMWRSVYEESGLPVWLGFSDIISLWSEDKEGFVSAIGRGQLIFIDDLFVTGYNELERSVVRDVVFKCYDTNKLLCFSSNILIEQADIDVRVKDRLKEMCKFIEIVGESRRV